MKLLVLTALTGALLLTGCAHNQVKNCEGNSYLENGKCKQALAKKIGVIKELKEKTMIVVLEDNSVVEIEKLKEKVVLIEENSIVNEEIVKNNLKIGDKINIYVK